MRRRLHESRNDDGVSLVELLVAISLFALVGTLTLNSVVTGLRSQTKLTDRSTAMAELRTAAHRISRDLRQADPILLARSGTLVLRQQRNGGTQRDLTLTVVGTDLVQDAVERNAAGVAGSPVRSVLLRNVDPTATPFGYIPSSSRVAVAGVDPMTCGITGTVPVSYSRQCIGAITLRLTRTVLQGVPLVLNQNVELRNA